MIRQNPKIKGVKVNGIENKIIHYADDTEVIMEGDKESFEEAINVINTFGNISGLMLNHDKSIAVWLGSRRNSRMRYMPHLNMIWNPDKFKVLGIWFTNDLAKCIKINLDDKFKEIKTLYKIWTKRQLTPLGRVAVLKSLILSKLVHLWLLLPNPPDDVIKEIQTSVFKFVWNYKNDKISRKVSTKHIINGGIGIPNIKQFIYALKLTWIRKVVMCEKKWKCFLIANNKIPYLCNLGSEVILHTEVNDFWTDVFEAYAEFGKRILVKEANEFVSEPLFCNNNILIEKKTFFSMNWLRKGVYTIGHLLDDDGTFLSYDNFTRKYNVKANFVTYYGCINASRKYARDVNTKFDCNFSD